MNKEENRKKLIDYCNTCGEELGTEHCEYQSLKNQGYFATKKNGDWQGEIIQECCEQCVGDMDEGY